jgi:outer membrane protein assembly factor BamE
MKPNDNQLRMRKLLIPTSLILATLSGCSSVGKGLDSLSSVTEVIPNALDKAPLIYRPTIQQGNVVTQAQVDKLRPGMSRRQVQFILGSPTLKDAFHRDRWDYPFTKGVGSHPDEFRYLSVFFKDDRLVRITGDLHPRPADQRKPRQKPAVVSVPDWQPEDKSLVSRALETVGLKGEK